MTDANDLVAALPDFDGIGRCYELRHRVRLGDTTPSGRLRLDAVARYLQDVANDDAYDSGIANPGAWVVRRTTIEVRAWPVLREAIVLRTWCSGTGPSWAERRTSIVGADGGRVEAASVWVQLDPVSGRPARLDDGFLAVYGPSTGGRRVRAKLQLGAGAPPSGGTAFPLRACDLDVIGHVNNAVAWAMVEQALSQRCAAGGRVDVEHHEQLEAADDPRLVVDDDRLWVLVGGRLCVAAAFTPVARSGPGSAGQPTSR